MPLRHCIVIAYDISTGESLATRPMMGCYTSVSLEVLRFVHLRSEGYRVEFHSSALVQTFCRVLCLFSGDLLRWVLPPAPERVENVSEFGNGYSELDPELLATVTIFIEGGFYDSVREVHQLVLVRRLWHVRRSVSGDE